MLAQQLVAAGETVVDVPPKLSARVRLLDTERSDKTDSHDARSAAVVALRQRRLRVVRLEDHTAVLRLLANRHHDLVALRTRAVCRLHTVLCHFIAGGLPRRHVGGPGRPGTAPHPTRSTRSTSNASRQALELLAEIRRADGDLAAAQATASPTRSPRPARRVTEVHGVGPIIAAYLLGYTGDIGRFPTAGHYARYNATAPIEASSGPNPRHRLNPRGNRHLNHAIHMAAVTQVRNDTPGRAYYLRKQAEGKSRKEAMRALKRRISDAVYRQLLADTTADTRRAREGNPGTTLKSSVTGSNPEGRLFGKATPGPTTNATTPAQRRTTRPRTPS